MAVPARLLMLTAIATLIVRAVLPLSSSRAQAQDRSHTVMLVDYNTKLAWERIALSAPQFTPARFFNQSLTSSLNLLSHLNYIPAERDQGSCGNCWAWAGTGALEIALDLQQGVHDRLSVQFINSCNSAINSCNGGQLTDLTGFYAEQRYAIPWSNTNAQWQSASGTNTVSCSAIGKVPQYGISSVGAQTISTHGLGQATAIANIKAALNQNKPIWFAFLMATAQDWNTFYSFWNNQSESAVWSDFFPGQSWTSGGAGHAVLVVGYNEDDPIKPYWIVLNSWGTANGLRPNGLFRVSMNLDYDAADSTGHPNLFWQILDVTFQTAASLPAPVLNAEPITTPSTSNTISWTPIATGHPIGVPSTAVSSGIVQGSGTTKVVGSPSTAVPGSVYADLKSGFAAAYARRTADKAVSIQPEQTKAIILPTAWQGIYSESFEGVFPGAHWTLFGNPTWNDTNYTAYTGSWSGWCSASSFSPLWGYPNNMDAWMVYGPFSIATAQTAQVSFWYKNSSELGYDFLQWMASTNGTDFYGHQISGQQTTWRQVIFDLTAVPGLGNLCGRDQVWFALNFTSDSTISGFSGAFVDDIVIQKDTLTAAPDLMPYAPAGWNDRIPIATTQLAGDAVHSFSGPFYSNQILYFNWATINQGTAIAGAYRVHVEVTGTGGGTWDWNISSHAVSQYWYLASDKAVGPLSAGTHTFKIWIDSSGAVAESHEDNNYYERTITVSSPNVPDLTTWMAAGWNDKIPIGTTQLAGDAVHSFNGPVYDNQTLYFNWATINQGTAVAGAYQVHVEVTGTGGGTWDWNISNNDVNSFWHLEYDQSVGPLTSGPHTFKIWVDYQGSVTEADESNNYYERTITVMASGAVRYYAECADNEGFRSPRNSDWISTTSFTFIGLTAGTNYWYRVKASNAGSQSTWSNVEHSQQAAQEKKVKGQLITP
jgi:hypothetical protein